MSGVLTERGRDAVEDFALIVDVGRPGECRDQTVYSDGRTGLAGRGVGGGCLVGEGGLTAGEEAAHFDERRFCAERECSLRIGRHEWFGGEPKHLR